MSANPAMVEGLADPQAQAEEAQRRDQMLLSAIEDRESNAIGNETDSVNTDRAKSIQYYLGEPFGNEIEGRSQVVSKDLFDTVEWIKPALLRIFASGDAVAEFSPQGPDDIETAKQESDYVDYVIQRKNPWFMLALEWFTDAMLTKNAYAMAYWEDQQETVLERYRGLTEDQLAMIGMDHTVQIIAHAANMTPQGVMHDIDVRRLKNYGCAKICILPPERCLVAQDARGMSVREHSDFFEYWEYKTISDLRIQGFDIQDDIDDAGGIEDSTVDQARDLLGKQITPGFTDNNERIDPSMRKVKTRMVWIRADYDGDGIAELRYVVAIGKTIIVNEEATGIPIASIVAYPMPHRHIGLDMYDVIGDLQLIKSAMLRAGIDNQYLANNGRTAADKNRVNLDDLLVSRPGGVVRVDGAPAEALMPFEHPQTVPGTIAMIEYLDGVRQDRGGVQKPMAGADLESINAQPGTIAQLTTAASQKVELLARIFGEGVKELFQIIHEITLENPTAIDKVQLRGEWTSVDPRQWKKRSDMHLTVGMGIGNRQHHIAGIMALLSLQKEALPYGLTDLSKVYNSLCEYTKALGFASGGMFFNEPPKGAQLQPQIPYQVQVAQINAQAQLLVQDLKNHASATLEQFKGEAEAAKTFFTEQQENFRHQTELAVRAISEATDRMHEMRLEKEKNKAGPSQ